ncbi:MAG: hypothetical protein J7529_06345 [Roseofilum sp. Guam]|nr:hypothetical protein [Roseofilum sp. Guam]
MPVQESDDKLLNSQFQRIAVFFAISFIGFGYILSTLAEIASPLDDRTCITGPWKLALILTHVLAFVLIPLAMKIFYQALTALQQSKSAIFASQLGLSFIMVSIASEIGWHVTQCWYYQDQFTMLNFMFYFFLLSAFALWSDGLAISNTWVTQLLNIVFAVSLLIVSILYPLGSIAEAHHDPNATLYKIPIYIALTLIFSVLTYRGYKLLEDWRIIFFPIFSVGVNLFFVFLLQKYGGDPYHDPHVTANALFHILHDLAGTETGVAIFTGLVYLKGRAALSGEDRNKPA